MDGGEVDGRVGDAGEGLSVEEAEAGALLAPLRRYGVRNLKMGWPLKRDHPLSCLP